MIRVRIFKKRYKPLPGHPNRGAWCWAIDRPNARGFHTLSKGRANTWEEACMYAHLEYMTANPPAASPRFRESISKLAIKGSEFDE